MIKLTRRTFRKESSEELTGIAVVSSGDPEKDQQEIKDHLLHSLRIDDGFCPNNCGPLRWTGPQEAECEICTFAYHANSPIEDWNKTHIFRSMEHPESGGVDAKMGDVEWELQIELQHEHRLIVRMGAQDYENLKQVFLAAAEDDDAQYFVACTNEDCGNRGIGFIGDPCPTCGTLLIADQREPG